MVMENKHPVMGLKQAAGPQLLGSTHGRLRKPLSPLSSITVTSPTPYSLYMKCYTAYRASWTLKNHTERCVRTMPLPPPPSATRVTRLHID